MPQASTPPSPLPRRTQAERRAASELNLLRAAAALVAEQGVAAATLEKVGVRAGYSRGLATQKFGSKQGLIEALIAHLHVRMEALLREAHVEQLPGLEGVLAFADLFLSELADDVEVRAYFMLMAGAVADLSPVRAAFAASHDIVSDRLQVLLRRGQQDGSVWLALQVEAAATLVGGLLMGLSTQHLIDPDFAPASIRDATLATVRRSLAR
jgi:AcrR family transcriptional regulator